MKRDLLFVPFAIGLLILGSLTFAQRKPPRPIVPPPGCGQAQVSWVGETYDDTTGAFIITHQTEPLTDPVTAHDRVKEIATQGTFGVTDFTSEYFPTQRILRVNSLGFGC